ncbi:hypothetical protein GCM10009837_14720 [Streptomyces durmitorensis]
MKARPATAADPNPRIPNFCVAMSTPESATVRRSSDAGRQEEDRRAMGGALAAFQDAERL